MRDHRGLDTTTPNSFYSKFANVTRATRTSPARIYDARARSLRTGARQRCACVNLVSRVNLVSSAWHNKTQVVPRDL